MNLTFVYRQQAFRDRQKSHVEGLEKNLAVLKDFQRKSAVEKKRMEANLRGQIAQNQILQALCASCETLRDVRSQISDYLPEYQRMPVATGLQTLSKGVMPARLQSRSLHRKKWRMVTQRRRLRQVIRRSRPPASSQLILHHSPHMALVGATLLNQALDSISDIRRMLGTDHQSTIF
jgi:hypothetical protein